MGHWRGWKDPNQRHRRKLHVHYGKSLDGINGRFDLADELELAELEGCMLTSLRGGMENKTLNKREQRA